MPQWIWFAFRLQSRLSMLFYDRLCFIIRHSFVERQCISDKKHLNISVIRGCFKSSPKNRKRPLLQFPWHDDHDYVSFVDGALQKGRLFCNKVLFYFVSQIHILTKVSSALLIFVYYVLASLKSRNLFSNNFLLYYTMQLHVLCLTFDIIIYGSRLFQVLQYDKNSMDNRLGLLLYMSFKNQAPK